MGALTGIRVVELSHELSAWAGKLLGDMGADVIVVEPPGGSPMRQYGPFAGDEPGPERTLYRWQYNTSKRGVVLDPDDAADRARLDELIATADVFLAAEPINRAAVVEAAAGNDALITVSVLAPPNSIDLTLLAEGGPVWSCGYDDHTLPPVRGGGNQGFHTASHWAVISTLVALLEREESGLGQHIDVDALAALNVTTEVATYGYLACNFEVFRQTGRHANATASMPTQLLCADGLHVNAGIVARKASEFRSVLNWLDSLGLRDEFPLTAFLEMGTEAPPITAKALRDDPVVLQMVMSVRDAQEFVASKVSAYDFFVSCQRHGIAAGVVYAPEELFADPQLVERGWPTPVEHPELGATYTYGGAPYRFGATPWEIQGRAPLLGEHQFLVETAAAATAD
jgi:benzylsuccinate CoA-transferase BbsE subunit